LVERVIVSLAKGFAEAGVVWGLGGSALLQVYRAVDRVNDVDVLVCPQDVEQASLVLARLGVGGRGEAKEPFRTERFYRFQIEGVGVDVLCRYRLAHEDGVYEHPFGRGAALEWVELGGVQVPLSAVEDWYVSYQLIPGREQRVQEIERHWARNGIRRPELLVRALEQCLPERIKDRVRQVLERVE
jgi:hypothetical protein